MKAKTLTEAVAEIKRVEKVDSYEAMQYALNYWGAIVHFIQYNHNIAIEKKKNLKKPRQKIKYYKCPNCGTDLGPVFHQCKVEKEFKSSIPSSDQHRIIHFYKTEIDNKIATIANKFGYSLHQVNSLINNHLKKANQSCTPNQKSMKE